jgi:heptosyltransferase-3
MTLGLFAGLFSRANDPVTAARALHTVVGSMAPSPKRVAAALGAVRRPSRVSRETIISTKVRAGRLELLLDRHGGHLLLRLISYVRRARPLPPNPKRIAITVFGAIGDTIVASALSLDIRRAIPGAYIVLVASATNASIAAVLCSFDAVITVPIKRPDVAVRMLRRARFDVLIDCNQWVCVSALHAAFAGCYTIGFHTPGQFRHYAYDFVVTHKNTVHELENYRALLLPLGIKPQAMPTLAISSRAHDAVALMLAGGVGIGRQTVVFHPWAGGANGKMKEWPASHWVELGSALQSRGFRIYVTGSKADLTRTEALVGVAAAQGVEFESLAGTIPLEQVAALLAKVDVVVSVNTGIMHLATAAGARVVALNGPVNPGRWGPLGDRSISLVPVGTPGGYLNLGFEYPKNAMDCMRAISAAAALSAVVALIGASQPMPSHPHEPLEHPTYPG